MESRRERRLKAKEDKVDFVPQYKSGIRKNLRGEEIVVGGNPKTYEEVYGVGNERFNNKYVIIKEVSAEDLTEENK